MEEQQEEEAAGEEAPGPSTRRGRGGRRGGAAAPQSPKTPAAKIKSAVAGALRGVLGIGQVRWRVAVGLGFAREGQVQWGSAWSLAAVRFFCFVLSLIGCPASIMPAPASCCRP